MKLRTPLIDFAGQSRKVYQVTVSETKSINVDSLAELFVAGVHYKWMLQPSSITAPQI